MNKTIQTCLVYALCLFTTFLVVINFFVTAIQDGLNAFKVKRRLKAPAILSDKRYGTHHYIKIKKYGIKLHYVEKGDRNKPLMLFLHGFPECWLSWRNQIEEFSANYWVVAADMRGYGESDKPKGRDKYDMEFLIEDIREMIVELGKSKCILVGHDWGGVIAWALVERYPEMFEKHVSINGPKLDVLFSLLKTNLTQLRRSWYIFFFQFPFLPEMMMRLKDLTNLVHLFRGYKNLEGEFPDEVIEAYQYYYSQKGAFTAPINYYRRAFNFDSATKTKVKVPTLIVWGEEDNALTEAVPRYTLPLCEDVRYEGIGNAGHFVHEENPIQVNEAIHRFLNRK